jgi:hypothetical protein
VVAAAKSKRLLKEPPSNDDIYTMVWELGERSPHSRALKGGACLDTALEAILKARFIPLEKDLCNKMFSASQGGFLSTFSAKVLTAYALNLLGPLTYHDMVRINEIRNVFAHSLHSVDFDNELIKADCQSLQLYVEAFQRHGEAPSNRDASHLFVYTTAIIWGILMENPFCECVGVGPYLSRFRRGRRSGAVQGPSVPMLDHRRVAIHSFKIRFAN